MAESVWECMDDGKRFDTAGAEVHKKVTGHIFFKLLDKEKK